MQLILKPISHPELDEIIVTETLFAIGRHELPFSRYEKSATAKLSKRHARLFEQDGAVYVADLGSLNGTTVNGRPLTSEPRRIKRDDELCFGGLCFRVEMLGGATTAPTAPRTVSPIKLVLTPETLPAQLETIVLTQFPFLVNKASDVFARYRNTLAEQLAFMSRKHAYIFERENELYIEDLGSTNGTFVSGKRLDEHARMLKENDTIALGSDQIVYRVHIFRETEDVSTMVPAIAGADPTRTVFVDSGTTFLDIFINEPEAKPEEDGAGADEEREEVSSQPPWWRRGRFGRSVGVFVDLYFALVGDSLGGRAARWTLLTAAVIGGAVAIAIYWAGAEEREVARRLDAGDFEGAARIADEYLAEDEGNTKLETLATDAVLKLSTPRWLQAIEARDYDQAGSVVAQGRALGEANPTDDPYLDLLDWAIRLERFIDERGGPERPAALFGEEKIVGDLLGYWETDPRARARLLGHLLEVVPEFKDARRNLALRVITLRNFDRDLDATGALRRSIDRALADGDPAELMKAIQAFGEQNPDVPGLDALREDAQRYLKLREDIDASRWLDAYADATGTPFRTPPLQAHVATLARDTLPTPEIVARYEAADAAWREGRFDEAIAALQSLTGERWNDVARVRLARYRDLVATLQALKTQRGKSGYADALFAFYARLDRNQDAFLVDALKGDLQSNRAAALEHASALTAAARDQWAQYERAGRIQAAARLEETVSDQYRGLARLLSDSSQSLTESRRIYTQLGVAPPQALVALDNDVKREIAVQRRAIMNLIVMEPMLRQQKLALLGGDDAAD